MGRVDRLGSELPRPPQATTVDRKLQGCLSLRAVYRSGLFIAQGCLSLRAVYRSGLFIAQGCCSLRAV